MAIVPLTTKDELQKALAIQRIITDEAQKEVGSIFSGEGEPLDKIARAAQLLEKYARYATLTEYATMPHLADSEKWGATFGVTAIVGSCVLVPAQRFGRTGDDLMALKDAYVKFLITLDKPTKRIEMDKLFGLFAILSESVGIIWAQNDNISLTVVGRRVLLHLMDAYKFVEEVAAANTKFQPEKSKKS